MATTQSQPARRTVVVFGATGNVGSAVMRRLQRDDEITSLIGVARRLPPDEIIAATAPKVAWHARDIDSDDLDVVEGADAVIDLAWKIQPQHDEATLIRTNVDGTQRIIDAVVERNVPNFIYASSVGTYAPHDKETRADESWPATGIQTSSYSRHKAAVEAMLDEMERRHPRIRVVRMRTSLVFQRGASSEIHRLFMGRLLPWHLPRPLRFVPKVSTLKFQATHADDIADAYHRALQRDVRGPFNIAAEPVLSPEVIADAVKGRTVPVPAVVLRTAAAVSFRLRLQPSEEGWLDMATKTPLMDVSRAHTELGWSATRTSVEALTELLDGIGDGAGDDTLPLHPRRRMVEEAR